MDSHGYENKTGTCENWYESRGHLISRTLKEHKPPSSRKPEMTESIPIENYVQDYIQVFK